MPFGQNRQLLGLAGEDVPGEQGAIRDQPHAGPVQEAHIEGSIVGNGMELGQRLDDRPEPARLGEVDHENRTLGRP